MHLAEFNVEFIAMAQGIYPLGRSLKFYYLEIT